MKKVAFVPIKLNNERLPGKNTKEFSNGVPLISYILNTLVNISELDEVYVYCSDSAIKKYLPEGVKFLKRDKVLDLSTTPFNQVLISFAENVESDIYVLTHATAPFISGDSILTGIEAIEENGYDSALSVVKMQEFFWKNGRPINYDVCNIPRTQDLEPYYKETCGLYIYKKDVILEKLRRIGDNPFLIEVSQFEAVDINTYEDFEMADIVRKKLEENNTLKKKLKK